jgi:hypothetical protein
MGTNTTPLSKKLKSYSALAGTMVAAASSSDAQIVYTNVNPDTTINTGGIYNLDLDNNGNIDFEFSVTHGTYMYGTFAITYDVGILTPMAGCAIDTAGDGAKAHVLNDAIDASLGWVDDATAGYQLLGGTAFGGAYTGGNFLGQTDKYIALRFKIGTNDHYGWARIDMDGAGTMVKLKDFAYNAAANMMIPAGAIVGIHENADLASHVNIFSLAKEININLKDIKTEGIVSVTNSIGQEVATVNISENQTKVSMANAAAGIYFVTFTQGSVKTTKKVIIQ